MDKISPDKAPELLSVSQMYKADELALSAVPDSFTLMMNAAHRVLDATNPLLNHGDSVTVFCGSGNNGGDGMVLSALLQSRGVVVTTIICTERDRLSGLQGDAARAFDWFCAQTGQQPITLDDLEFNSKNGNPTQLADSSSQPQALEALDLSNDITRSRLIVDAILGAGLTRRVTGRHAAIIRAINNWRSENTTLALQQQRLVLSVDLPSGIDGDTGQINGTAIKADHTITFFRQKPAHWTYPGRTHCGVTPVSYTHLTLPTKA